MPESDGVLHAKRQLAADLDYIEQLKRKLQEVGLSAEEVERALQPALSFHVQLQEELAQLERATESGAAGAAAPSQAD